MQRIPILHLYEFLLIFKSRDEFNDLKDYYEDDDNPEDSRNPIVNNQDNTMEATINQKIQ